MDPYTLAYLAGHSDYVHPQAQTIRDAMARAGKAQGGHKNGHSGQKSSVVQSEESALFHLITGRIFGRGEWIRTTGLLVPNQALYQAEPRPDTLLTLAAGSRLDRENHS